MAIPWDEVRKDFPALERRVYLNAAATGVPPPTVRPAVDAFYRALEEGGDVHWDDWMARREEVRTRVAGLIGAEAEEIYRECVAKGAMLLPGLTPRLGPEWTRSRSCATRLTWRSANFCQSPISSPIITSRTARWNSSIWSASFRIQTFFSPPRTCKQVR